MSRGTFYKWKATYSGMDVSQARKLKALEDENARVKRLLADAMLDNAVLREVAKKMYGLPRLASVSSGWQYSLRKCSRPVCGASRPLP